MTLECTLLSCNTRPHPICVFLLAAFSTLSVAAQIPANLNDNVVTCDASTHCSSKTMFGRNYNVIETTRFTVMVSMSREGRYMRADISIANHAGYPQNVSPDDFRVEVLAPKLKTLPYVPPSELRNLPTSKQSPIVVSAAQGTNIGDPEPASERKAVSQEAMEKKSAQEYLTSAAIPANDVVRGRVYFQRDRGVKQANLLLPISGLVFEFPYSPKF